MALVRLKQNDWKKALDSIATQIKYKHFLAVRKKHQILKLPIVYNDKLPDTLDDKIERMISTIRADRDYKAVHPEADVQNDKSLNDIEALKGIIRLLKDADPRVKEVYFYDSY